MKRWLLVSNCTAMGLGNCLSLLSPEVQVDAFDVPSFEQAKEGILPKLKEYERVLVLPFGAGPHSIQPSMHPAIKQFPAVLFHAYHPDICYLAATGPLSLGPTGHYHSAIAYAAFRCGLDEKQAAALFTGEIYEAMGYYQAWDRDRDTLVGYYRAYGFDIRQAFVDWSRHGPFMHSCNHPKIHVLRDLAKLALEQAGYATMKTSILPHDNLTAGPCVPVYPEIGARLGVQGDMTFKSGGSYRSFGLQEFIEGCYKVYRANPEVQASYPSYLPLIERAIEVVGAAR